MIGSGIVLVLILAIFLYLNHIRTTPYGKMELKSALLTKVVKEYKGDDIFFFRKEFAKFNKASPHKFPVDQVKDFAIPVDGKDIPVRLYHQNSTDKIPLVIYIHGGGWCIGSLDTHDQQCRRLAKKSGFAILSIDYTLSPEAKFPTALNEVCHVIKHIQSNGLTDNIDHSQIAIAGDSAGGNMAITTALKLNDMGLGEHIKCLVPIYPVTSCDLDKGGSFKEFANGYLLTEHLMGLFSKNYIEEGVNLRDPYLAPLYSDKLSDLPPQFVLTAGLDPLRDEGEAYVAKLQKVGTTVEFKRYDNTLHGFYGRSEFGKKGIEAIDDTVVFLKKYLT